MLDGNADFSEHDLLHGGTPGGLSRHRRKLGNVGLLKQKNGWRRVVIENLP
jgi:hypothetical protein